MKKTAAAASALALGAFTLPAHAEEPAGGEHDWTGFYVGGGVGAAGGEADWEIDGGEGFFSDEDGPADASDKSASVSVVGGYNHQFGPIVVGGEADFTVTDIDAQTRFDGGEFADLRTKLQSLGTARARVGYAMDRVLCFATGGVAVGDMKSRYESLGSPSPDSEKTTVGWVAGGGVEVAISENLSLVAEAFYASFGEENGTAQGPFYDDQFEVETVVKYGRVGINYNF